MIYTNVKWEKVAIVGDYYVFPLRTAGYTMSAESLILNVASTTNDTAKLTAHTGKDRDSNKVYLTTIPNGTYKEDVVEVPKYIQEIQKEKENETELDKLERLTKLKQYFEKA